jgi:hypothetical protein
MAGTAIDLVDHVLPIVFNRQGKRVMPKLGIVARDQDRELSDEELNVLIAKLRLVLRLDSSDQQQLLSAANAHRWTVNRLEAETRKYHQHRGGGRRPRPELARKTELIGRLMTTLHQLQEGLPDVDAVADIIGEARVAIAASLESLERAQTLLLKVSEPARAG